MVWNVLHVEVIKVFFYNLGATSFKEAMKMGSETYHHLKMVIKKEYGQDGKNWVAFKSRHYESNTAFSGIYFY